jgi:hypothetical protein
MMMDQYRSRLVRYREGIVRRDPVKRKSVKLIAGLPIICTALHTGLRHPILSRVPVEDAKGGPWRWGCIGIHLVLAWPNRQLRS